MVEIIAPLEDNGLPESVRNEIHQRYKDKRSWNKVFQPIEDIERRNKYIELFNALEHEE